ncbi:MAG: hypothetical protein ACOCRX_01395 [Candidatus Woesearchaeota archaeon]
MSGYFGYSMSNNAIDAYDDYIMPISKLKKFLGIKEISYSPCEWHHTSKKYNVTYFYDARDAVRYGDIFKFSNKYPNPIQRYHRLLIQIIIIDDAGIDIPKKLQRRFERLSKEADEYMEKLEKRRKEKREKKRLIELKKAKKEEEQRRTDYKKKLKYRCKEMGITQKRIKKAFYTEPEDVSNIYSQIRKWFDFDEKNKEIDLKQALECAIDHEESE